MIKSKEIDLHLSIATYIRLQYPNVIFRSDFAAGMKMTMGQAMRMKRMQCDKGYPDLFVAECRKGKGGLFLEIKNGRSKVFKKDGTLLKNEHVEKQAQTLIHLRKAGYEAEFVCSFDEARKVIDLYLHR